MADKTINVKVAIDTADSAKSLGDIKKSIKELDSAALSIGEGGKGFTELNTKAAQLRDKLEDLKDTTKTLKGTGVEKLTASFGLLKESLSGGDIDKAKVAFQGIGMAMKAIPLVLIIEGIKYLIDNFDKLAKKAGIIGDIFRAIGDAITWVTDKLGLTNSKLEAQGEAITNAATSAKDALALQTAEYDRQIAAAKAAGESTVELEIAKQEAIVNTNKTLIEQTIAYVRSGGVLTEEQRKLLTEQIEAIKNAKNEEFIITKNAEKDKNEESKKFLEERKKQLETETQKRLEELEKQRKFEEDINNRRKKEAEETSAAITAQLNNTLMKQGEAEAAKADQDFIDTENKRAAKKANEKLDYQDMLTNIQKERDAKLNNIKLTEAERIKIIQESNEKEKQLRADTAQAGLSIAQQSTDGLQSLSDFVFAVKAANLQKGSKAEEEAARKQFKINKALAITSAVISTIQGVINALTAQSVIPEPFGTILKVASAVAVGIAGAANIAKISATQFNAGSSSGGSSAASIPSPSSGAATTATSQAPTFGPQTFGINSGAAGINTPGLAGAGVQAPPPQKVYVTQTDIADQNRKVDVIQERATIG